MVQTENDWRALVQDILKDIKKQGASAAEVAASSRSGFSVDVRLGEVEKVEYNRDKGIAITVYYGQKKGSASTTDTSQESIESTVKAACHIAKFTEEDSCAGLADKELLASNYPDLDLHHLWQITVEQGIELAKECEALARAEDKRITNSEGASVATHQGVLVYGNSNNFLGSFKTTRHSINCALIAQEGSNMQRDYSFTVARDSQDLNNVKSVARDAAQRAVRRLGAKRLTTRQAPVVFESNIARGLIGSFINAIQGGNLYRKSSFLVDYLGKKIFSEHVHIYEQPHLKKGLGSAPFDGEGVATKDHDLVKDGILQSYALSSYSARKLGMQTTGNAGGVHNVFIDTSDIDLSGLLQQMGTGLFVTELLGQGVNIVTGDYSRGAMGFWVENGVIQYPVEEITIAGNLRDMFLQLVAIGNDVDRRGNIQTGSILIGNMTIAGE